jgi:Fur family peroxide stress response transcriptional regulator
MQENTRKLKQLGIRITPQRLAVYKVLAAGGHLSVETIYKKIRKDFPAVSLATVYTILEAFRNKRIISEIRIKFNKSHFELRSDRHHHFFCNQCGRIFDIDIPECSSLQKGQVQGHLIQQVQGYFYGVCSNCRK